MVSPCVRSPGTGTEAFYRAVDEWLSELLPVG